MVRLFEKFSSRPCNNPSRTRGPFLGANLDRVLSACQASFDRQVLGTPYTCFNAKHYGQLLIVDPEEEFYPDEIVKLQKDVHFEGLSVIGKKHCHVISLYAVLCDEGIFNDGAEHLFANVLFARRACNLLLRKPTRVDLTVTLCSPSARSLVTSQTRFIERSRVSCK